jgi:hypothetical protein
MHRPPDGTLVCPIAGCNVEPYVTEGGRSYHLRVAHGIWSMRRDSVQRRERRRRARVGPLRRPGEVPASRATETYVAAGRDRPLGPRAHAVLAAILARLRWHIELGCDREAVLDGIFGICRSNFAPIVATGRRSWLLSDAQRCWLRLRLLYVVNGAWSRELDAKPHRIRDAIVVVLESEERS